MKARAVEKKTGNARVLAEQPTVMVDNFIIIGHMAHKQRSAPTKFDHRRAS